jgi:predicted kinase
MGKALDTFVEVWHETFPNQKSEARNKMEERKKRTKMVREMEEKQASMTPEELEAYE